MPGNLPTYRDYFPIDEASVICSDRCVISVTIVYLRQCVTCLNTASHGILVILGVLGTTVVIGDSHEFHMHACCERFWIGRLFTG